MISRLSISLLRSSTSSSDRIACRGCSHDFCSTTERWKDHARIIERPLRELAAIYTTGSHALLREFVCPACGLTLDSEVARAEDPPLIEYFTAVP